MGQCLQISMHQKEFNINLINSSPLDTVSNPWPYRKTFLFFQFHCCHGKTTLNRRELKQKAGKKKPPAVG